MLSHQSSAAAPSPLPDTITKLDIYHAYLDAYITYIVSKDTILAREAGSGLVNRGLSFVSSNKYLSPEAIKIKAQYCSTFKQRLTNATHAKDYIELIIEIAKEAIEARKAGVTSIYAMCLFGLRTRLIHDIEADRTSKLFLDFNAHIQFLLAQKEAANKELIYADTQNGNNANTKDKEKFEKNLLELAYIGDRSSVIEAYKEGLLGTVTLLRRTLYTDASSKYAPIEPYYKRPNEEAKTTEKNTTASLPVLLKFPMEFQPNLYCWLPTYLSTDNYPKSDEFDSKTKLYSDATLLEKAGKYSPRSDEPKHTEAATPKPLTIVSPATAGKPTDTVSTPQFETKELINGKPKIPAEGKVSEPADSTPPVLLNINSIAKSLTPVSLPPKPETKEAINTKLKTPTEEKVSLPPTSATPAPLKTSDIAKALAALPPPKFEVKEGKSAKPKGKKKKTKKSTIISILPAHAAALSAVEPPSPSDEFDDEKVNTPSPR